MDVLRRWWERFKWAEDIYDILQWLLRLGGALGLTAWTVTAWNEIRGLPASLQTLYFVAVGLVLLPLTLLVLLVALRVIPRKRYVEFYDSRQMLNAVRGGIERELRNAKEVWVIWATGSVAPIQGAFRLGRITRVVLYHPRYVHLGLLADMSEPGITRGSLSADIRQTTQMAQQAAARRPEVRWYNGPLSFLVIGDPNTPRAWARVDDFFSYMGRPSYIVVKREHPELLDQVVAYYEHVWARAKAPS